METINESRATREAHRGSLFDSLGTPASTSWRNKLIWGDNKLVAGSLLKEFAGQVNLVYIDPPFDTGADFSFHVKIGDEEVTKEPSIIEEHAYSDTWGAGRASYLRMMYERLVLVWELLTDGGSFYLHCAPNVSHYLKLVGDEIFGSESFRSEIIWQRTSAHSRLRRYGPVHDVILYYTKGDDLVWNPQYLPYSEDYINAFYYRIEESTGRRYRLSDLTSRRPGGRYLWKGSPPLSERSGGGSRPGLSP